MTVLSQSVFFVYALQVFCNVYQQWFPCGNASIFAGFMFDAFDTNKVNCNSFLPSNKKFLFFSVLYQQESTQ